MAKPKMKYFEIVNGRRQDIDEESMHISKFGTYISTNYGKKVDTDLTLPTDSNEYAFLKTNPFLISWNRSNEDYKSYTFDEFIIRYKNQDYRFGEFINSKRIGYGKKKRFVRKLFDKWDEEFKNKRDSSVEKVNANLDLAKNLYYEKKSFIGLLIMFLFAVVVAIGVINPEPLFTSLDSLIDSDFFTRVYNKLLWIYYSQKITFVVGVTTLIFLIVYLISHVIYNVNCSAAKGFIGDHREWLSKNQRKIAEKYRKNFKKVKRYYLSNINRKCKPFPPYRLKNVEMKTNVDSLDRLNVVVLNKIHHHKSAIQNSRKFANMMFAFSIILIIVYCLLVIYNAFFR